MDGAARSIARGDGRSLGGTLGQTGIEALRIGLEWKESSRPNVHQTGLLEQRGHPPREPAVHGRGIGRRRDDPACERAVGMGEGRHVGVHVEDTQASARSEDSNELGDLPVSRHRLCCPNCVMS
jgi:hypothetical protein